jgi:predicted AAA+ superfamily ATPase
MSKSKPIRSHKEIQAEKDLIRAKILILQARAHGQLKTLQKIPDSVVNGSLQDIQAYKAFSDEAGKLYHVNNAPGKKKTAKQLTKIMLKLQTVCRKLHLDPSVEIQEAAQ